MSENINEQNDSIFNFWSKMYGLNFWWINLINLIIIILVAYTDIQGVGLEKYLVLVVKKVDSARSVMSQ